MEEAHTFAAAFGKTFFEAHPRQGEDECGIEGVLWKDFSNRPCRV